MLTKQIETVEGTYYLNPTKDKVVLTGPLVQGSLPGGEPIEILWADMENLPLLADALGDLKVKVFRPVVEALGVMYSNRALYEALIE